MEAHCGEALTVPELALHTGVSQSHLNALFRHQTGHGALHTLTEIRMRLARRLLLNPYYNISEVAARCGIPDSGYFTRSFKRFHGVTPGEYRQNPARFTDRPQMGVGGVRLDAREPRIPGDAVTLRQDMAQFGGDRTSC